MPKIHNDKAAILGESDVARLPVPVDHLQRVNMRQGTEQLTQNHKPLLHAHVSKMEATGKGHAAQLQHKEAPASGNKVFNELHNTGATSALQHVTLVLSTCAASLFYRDSASCASCQPDLAITTLPKTAYSGVTILP